MVKIGIDVSDIQRIRTFFERKGEKFMDRVLTPREKEYVSKHSNFLLNLAGRFSAKEAFFKAIGTGIINFHDVEILNHKNGKPYVNLYGKVKEIVQNLNAKSIDISISHTDTVAVSVVIIDI